MTTGAKRIDQGHDPRACSVDERLKLAEATRRLMSVARAKAVILFGSRATGEHSRDSDFDLCVLIPQDANPTTFSPTRLRPAVADLGITVDIVTVRPSDLLADQDDVNSLAYDIVRCGVILDGDAEGLVRR